MDRPKRIALLTVGTRGDTAPFLALGRALARRGHAVTIGALDHHRRVVEGRRLRFVSLGEGFDDFMESDVARLFASRSLADRLKLPLASQRMVAALGSDLMEGCRIAIRDADLVIHHPILIFAPAIAKRYGVPALMAAPQPLAATAEFPLCILARRDLGRALNRASYGLFTLERAVLALSLRRFLRERVAPDAPPGAPAPRALTPAALFAYSPAVGPVARDWGDAVAVTGVWRDPPDPKWRPSPELERALTEGPPPIYVGFGSMPWNARRNRDLIAEAVRLWGGRAIVSAGWGGIATGDLPPHLVAVGNAPHAALFPRVAAVVHHGGAGTTAAGLAAGRPTFVTPILMDQAFWGERVARLGAGPPPVALAKLDPPRLAAAFRDLVDNPSYRHAAEAVAARMADEDGIAAAVAIVDCILADDEAPARAALTLPPDGASNTAIALDHLNRSR